jgi:hypothetical protein
LPGSERDIAFSPNDVATAGRNLSLIAKEKDEAWQEAQTLQAEALGFAQRAAFPHALACRWQEEWQGFALYCQLFMHAQKAFFTLHYATVVENNWSMREICQVNIQELYRCAVEMDTFCAKHPDASPGMHVIFDASRVRALADSLHHQADSAKSVIKITSKNGGSRNKCDPRRFHPLRQTAKCDENLICRPAHRWIVNPQADP